MNASPQPSEHELVARVERERGQLLQAADVLRKPVQTVSRVEQAVRRWVPVLPYAIGVMGLIGIVGSLLRARGVKPVLLIATALDLWRIWKSLQASHAAPGALSAGPRAVTQASPPFGERHR